MHFLGNRQQISSMGRLMTKEKWKTCQYAKSAESETWDLEVYSVLRNFQIILDGNVPITWMGGFIIVIMQGWYQTSVKCYYLLSHLEMRLWMLCVMSTPQFSFGHK
jgi:hypothetical protein